MDRTFNEGKKGKIINLRLRDGPGSEKGKSKDESKYISLGIDDISLLYLCREVLDTIYERLFGRDDKDDLEDWLYTIQHNIEQRIKSRALNEDEEAMLRLSITTLSDLVFHIIKKRTN